MLCWHDPFIYVRNCHVGKYRAVTMCAVIYELEHGTFTTHHLIDIIIYTMDSPTTPVVEQVEMEKLCFQLGSPMLPTKHFRIRPRV